MPSGDGTGPLGLGPKTGSGRGLCNNAILSGTPRRAAFGGRKHWLIGLAAPIVVALIHDLANPTGILRHFPSAFLQKRAAKNPQRIRCDTEFSVLHHPPSKLDHDKEKPHDAGTDNE
jgi:hypothetical protein